MAVLWQKKTKDCHYQVRTAGRSVRLYSNGVFHSQWNPGRPLGGHIWDLLFIPTLFHANAASLEKVLVLGVGGGAVINLFNRFLQPKAVVGVDLDAEHLHIARKYFLDSTANVRLVRDDAIAFAEREPAKSYDVIVEDLFASDDVEGAVRAVAMDHHWLTTLAAALNDDGLLIINFESLAQLRACLKRPWLKEAGFKSVYHFYTDRYENAIAVCLKNHRDKRFLTQRVQDFFANRPRSEVVGMNYHAEQVIRGL